MTYQNVALKNYRDGEEGNREGMKEEMMVEIKK